MANRNVLLFHGLSEQAEALSRGVSQDCFPVLLPPLANRRRVTEIEFRRLLVDAMLTTHKGGFRLILNSGDSDPNDLKLKYEGETASRVMPPRLRFSIAHELAHTLFYDLSGGTPQISKEFRSGGGKTELENLEKNCNKLAAAILLPRAMMKASLQRMKSLEPQSLVQLAREAGVSVEALIRRLSGEGSLLVDPYFRGCIVLAKRAGNETIVAAIAKPPRINLAAGLLLMRAGERCQLMAADGSVVDPHALPPEAELTLSTELGRHRSLKPYRVLRAQVGHTASTVSSLITFEELEDC